MKITRSRYFEDGTFLLEVTPAVEPADRAQEVLDELTLQGRSPEW